MTAPPIKIFNVFDLQFECNNEDQLHIQETIQYCEARFRVLLCAFGRAGHPKQRVIQRGLHKELTFVLSYIGMATAIGLVIDIPVIIRSLSRDFYRSAVRHNYSIPLERDFLLALDAGIVAVAGPPAVKGYTVKEFHCSWWTMEDDNFDMQSFSNQILDINNIDDCLAFHRHQISLLPAAEPSNTPSLFKPRYIWKSNALQPITETDHCKRCRLYRAVAMGTLDDHRDIRNQIQGMEASFSAQKERAIRRAAGFFQLFEYLNIKEQDLTVAAAAVDRDSNESDSLPSPAPGLGETMILPPIESSKRSKKHKKTSARRAVAAKVREEAISDVKRMENIPSLKWTWGVTMDNSDIPHIRRFTDKGKSNLHSGYDRTLTHGTDTRTTSTMNHETNDFDMGYFSDVSEDARRPVPPLDTRTIPSCLYMHMRKKPSRYLVGFNDHPVDPMDVVVVPPLAAPYEVPPPRISLPIISDKEMEKITLPKPLHTSMESYLMAKETDIVHPSIWDEQSTNDAISLDDPSSSPVRRYMTTNSTFNIGEKSYSNDDSDDSLIVPVDLNKAAAAYLSRPPLVPTKHTTEYDSEDDRPIMPVNPVIAAGAFLSREEGVLQDVSQVDDDENSSDGESEIMLINPAVAAAAFLSREKGVVHDDSQQKGVLRDNSQVGDENVSDESDIFPVNPAVAAAAFLSREPIGKNTRAEEEAIMNNAATDCICNFSPMKSSFHLPIPDGPYTAEHFENIPDEWMEGL